MEINIREWARDDLHPIRRAWLDYCQNLGRSDMQLRPDADGHLRQWLNTRFREPHSFGFVAEAGISFAGFLIGRVHEWETVPPVIQPRRIGIIDAVYVDESYRRRGIGKSLIDRAIETMRAADAAAVETIYDAWNDASAKAWAGAGFHPWMVHVYRML
jgi:ribosomal protein S18 acetylase RimI-like enzyme